MQIIGYICIIVFLLCWNVLSAIDIVETLQSNKRRLYFIQQAQIQKSSFWCVILDMVIVICMIAHIIG